MIRTVTWGAYYWPIQATVMVLSILVPEMYALLTNVYNTQSYWVWNELNMSPASTGTWTAIHYLAFGTWLVLVSWLTFHYFFRMFT